jgi:exosortase A-associated hydrolase 2
VPLPQHPPAEPFFLEGEGGTRFCLFHAPAGRCRGALLYVHPFAEEMNRTRRLAAQQARALAAQGIGVLLIDLHGCGDSSGDFGDARWDGWKADLALGCAWLQDRLGMTPGLWGARLGALLALDYAHGAPQPPAHLLLWQPVLSGSASLTQFLRLVVARDMLADATGASGGTQALRARLARGETLEVAGYDIAPDMAAALDATDAARLAIRGCPVHWFEVVPEPGRSPGPASARIAAEWRAAGIDLKLEAVAGLPFWRTQEVAECPALLAATTALFTGSGDAI